MKEVRLNSFVMLVLIPIIAMLTNKMPESWLDGPFNHNTEDAFFDDANLVSNTLYHNNKTDYYTVWDEDARKYVTYDRRSNAELETVVFNAPEPGASRASGRVRLINGWENVAKRGSGIMIIDGKVAHTTELDEEGMRIQEEFGCTGCHEA